MLSKELLEEIATDAMLTERIVDRAEKLNALNMDRTVACAFIVMAKTHYDLDFLRIKTISVKILKPQMKSVRRSHRRKETIL